MQWHLGDVCPECELVTSTPTLVAVVAALAYVHGERPAMLVLRFVQRTVPIPLISSAMNALESQQVEHLLHGDLLAKAVEIDTRHGWSSFSIGKKKETVPFPLSI
jgi:hypothetical protein